MYVSWESSVGRILIISPKVLVHQPRAGKRFQIPANEFFAVKLLQKIRTSEKKIEILSVSAAPLQENDKNIRLLSLICRTQNLGCWTRREREEPVEKCKLFLIKKNRN